MSEKEKSGSPLNREGKSEVEKVEEIQMLRCFNVATKGGLEYLAQYIPPFSRMDIKVTYPYTGGEVEEHIRKMVVEAVLKKIKQKVSER